MAANWLLKEKPVAVYHNTSQLYLDPPTGNHNRDVKDVPSYRGHRPCNAVPATRALSLPAAFVSVSVLVLLVYICSLSFRSRISKRLFGRKLAGGTDGEGGGESGSCITHTDEEAISSTQLTASELPIPSSKGRLHAARWHAGSETAYRTPPYAKSVTAAPVERPSRAAKPQLRTMEWPRRSKRKQRGKDAVGREAKKNKLEAPIQQGLPGTSVPPLDPELDSLIDSILFEDLSVLYGDTWLLDDAITPLTPSTLESEDAAPREVFAGQQSLDAPMPTAKMPTSLLPGSVSTLDSSDPPATSPSSFFESVLSEASQSTPGLYADDWLSSGDAEVVDEALGLIDSRATPSMLLGSSGESQEGAGSRVEISAGPYKGEMYVGASSSSKRLIHDSHLDAVLEPADVSPGMSSTSTDPESGRAAGVLESSSLRSLLSSASSDHPPSGRETDVAVHSGEPAEQLTSELTRSAVKELQAAVEGFEEMLRGIPDHVLENHPFYRHPGPQLRLNWRSFSDAYAACYRTWRQNIVLLLSKCRYLLKKPWLTTEEFGELVCHTERLCGYASGFMHVDVTGPFAIESLGRAFIVLDTLHCAAEVLGQSARKDEWWPGIVRRIRDAGYIGTFDKRKLGKKPWAYPLVKALRVALDYYMMGKRPPLHLVIGLKFSLFMSSMPTDFLSSRWDPWRNDATEWLKSIKPKTQASA